MTLEDVTKLFYFMTFIHKYHILSKKVDFSPFFTHFGHFGGLPYWNGKKWIKWKRCASSIPICNVASVFSFSVRKGFKMSKNWSQKCLTNNVQKQDISQEPFLTLEDVPDSWDGDEEPQMVPTCSHWPYKSFKKRLESIPSSISELLMHYIACNVLWQRSEKEREWQCGNLI